MNVKPDQPRQLGQTNNSPSRRGLALEDSTITIRSKVQIKFLTKTREWIRLTIQAPTFRSRSSKVSTILVVQEERSMVHSDPTKTICTLMHQPNSSKKVSKWWLQVRKALVNRCFRPRAVAQPTRTCDSHLQMFTSRTKEAHSSHLEHKLHQALHRRCTQISLVQSLHRTYLNQIFRVIHRTLIHPQRTKSRCHS